MPSREGSVESLEETDSQHSGDQDPSSSSPVILPRFESLSPSSSIAGDTSHFQQLAASVPGAHDEPSRSSQQEVRSTTAPTANIPSPSAISQRTMPVVSVSDSDSDDDLIPGDLFQPLIQAQAASQFYNPRVQADLALPQKRRRAYSPDYSETCDYEEERKLDLQVLGDPGLMLLRNPPPWRTPQSLTASHRMPVSVVKPKPDSHGGLVDPKPPVTHLAKKRKTGMGGAMGIWNQIKASSKTPSQSTSGSVSAPASTHTSTTSTKPTLGGRQVVPKIEPLQKQDNKPVRRTTLGRAPRPPGTIVWKSK